jgi:hypothetical protein
MTNKALGRLKLDEDERNKQEIYSILYLKKKATSQNIWKSLDRYTMLENQKIKDQENDEYEKGLITKNKRDLNIKKRFRKTISLRTIQRHLKDDKRIIKNGRYYSIHDVARFEVRNLYPEAFGSHFFGPIFNFGLKYNKTSIGLESNLKEFIIRCGILLIYNFIEASRPFKDPSMSIREKKDLIEHWAIHGISIIEMFDMFQVMFQEDGNNKELSTYEISDNNIGRLLGAMEKLFPKIYQTLIEARNELPYYPGPKSIPYHIRGKKIEPIPRTDLNHLSFECDLMYMRDKLRPQPELK